jgi:hypothetical protein
MGTVPIRGLTGDNLANAMLKALTKAKRRLTLSLCGLGMLDELEVETIPNAIPSYVDPDTGEIRKGLPARQERPTEPPSIDDADMTQLLFDSPAPSIVEPIVTTTYPSETAEGLSRAEFRAFLDAEGFTSGDAMNAAFRVFPSWNGKRELTDIERQAVRRHLVTA